MTDPVRLTIGVSDCDRLRALAEGGVTIPGVDARVTVMPLQPLFNEQLTKHTFDAVESRSPPTSASSTGRGGTTSASPSSRPATSASPACS